MLQIPKRRMVEDPDNPRDTMKAINRILAFAVLALCWLAVMTSCAEMPLTLAIEGEHGVYSYSSKGGLRASFRIREEKFTPDMRRVLRGHPITRQEIANRWKP